MLRRTRAARPRVRARLRIERPLLRQLHEHRRRHGRRATSSAPRLRRWPISSSRFDLQLEGTRRFIDTALLESQRRTSGVRARTDTSTSASATADRATIPTIVRRTRTNCSARCCASTSTCPTQTRSATGFRRTIRSSEATRRATKSGRSACATRGATASTMSRAAARARWSSPTSGRTARGNQLRAARRRRPQLRLAQPRRGARQRHVASARLSARRRIRSSNTAATTASR